MNFSDHDYSALSMVSDDAMEKQAFVIAPLILAALGAWGAYSSGKDAYRSARNGQWGRALLHSALAATSLFTGGMAGGAANGAKAVGAASRLGRGWLATKNIAGRAGKFVSATKPARNMANLANRGRGAFEASRFGQAAMRYGRATRNGWNAANRYAKRWNDIYDTTRVGKWIADNPAKSMAFYLGVPMLAGDPDAQAVGGANAAKIGLRHLADNGGQYPYQMPQPYRMPTPMQAVRPDYRKAGVMAYTGPKTYGAYARHAGQMRMRS